MPSPRVLKLADQIKMITAEMLERRVKDPRLGFVTVTDVRLTGDTREATIFYTVLGDDADQASSAAALKSATGIIRSQVGKQLGLRFTPMLNFIADSVPETARQIEESIARAKMGDAEIAQRSAGAQYAGDADPYKHDDEDDAQDEEDDDEDEDTDDEDADDESDLED